MNIHGSTRCFLADAQSFWSGSIEVSVALEISGFFFANMFQCLGFDLFHRFYVEERPFWSIVQGSESISSAQPVAEGWHLGFAQKIRGSFPTKKGPQLRPHLFVIPTPGTPNEL